MRMAYTFRPGDISKFDLQVDWGTDFLAWKAQWEAYMGLSRLDKEPETKQEQALTLCLHVKHSLLLTTLASQNQQVEWLRTYSGSSVTIH